MPTKSGYTTVVLRRAAKDGYTPTIGSNGNWFIGDTDTGRTSKGDNGFSPQLGDNGNWWEYDATQGKYTDTGIKAHGTDAHSPCVNSSGNWMLWDDTKQEYVDSGKTSRGDDGNAPCIGDDGYWYEYDATTKQYKKTNIKAQGLSAYEVWLKSNPGKTEADYLASLVGAQGLSAYEVYKKGGGTLNESQWLESLDGKPGASAYDLYKAGGGTKSEADWLDSLKGATGTSITGVEEQYCYGSDTTPNDSWGTTVITPKNESGKYYVWNREKISYSSGGTSYTTAHLTGKYVKDGDTGRGISSYTEKYTVTSSTTVPTSFPYDKISDAIAKITDTDRYLWNQETITYTKGTPATESSVRLISIKGEKGNPGNDSTVPGPSGPTGCVIRQLGEWQAGTYYNDSNLTAPRSGEDNRYIDIVYKKGQDGNPIFYKVKDSVKSTNTTPPNTEYWAEVQQTELTATKVLLANNAYIAMTQGNALQLQCNGSTPHFTAGAAGGTESDGKHSGYAFWAGTNTTDIPTDAQKAAAPFSIDHNGAMKASKGTIAGFNITATNFWSGVDSNALVDGYDQVYIGPKDLIINSKSTGYFVYNNGSSLRELCVSGGYNNPSTGVFNVMSSSEGEAVRITNAKQTVATGIGLFLNGFTTALKMNTGCISGAAFKTQVCSSNTTLSLGVNAVAISSACTVTFPSVLGTQDDVYRPNNDGYVLNVKRLHGGSSDCYVTADSGHFIIYTDDNANQKEATTLAIEGQGDAMMFIFFANVGSTTIKKSDGKDYKGAWIQWKNPREW